MALAGLLMVPANGGLTIEPDTQPSDGGIRSFTVISEYQNGPNKLEVLLPDRLEAGKRYPVLYTLPVNTGTHGPWGSAILELRKLDVHNRYGVIVVAPAYDVEPWFGDMPKPESATTPWIRQQGYVLDVVIPFIDKQYPTVAERNGRFLIGFSKSGFGAFGLILRNPDVFAKVAVFDCADPNPTEKIFDTWGMKSSYGRVKTLMRISTSSPCSRATA